MDDLNLEAVEDQVGTILAAIHHVAKQEDGSIKIDFHGTLFALQLVAFTIMQQAFANQEEPEPETEPDESEPGYIRRQRLRAERDGQ